MSRANVQRLKIDLGVLLGVAIGAVCHVLHIPSQTGCARTPR